MGIYLKDMKMPEDGCHHIICIYADGVVATGGREYKAIPVPPHGKLIDANEFLHRAIGTKCFDEDYARMLQQLVGESVTIIPAEEGN